MNREGRGKRSENLLDERKTGQKACQDTTLEGEGELNEEEEHLPNDFKKPAAKRKFASIPDRDARVAAEINVSIAEKKTFFP